MKEIRKDKGYLKASKKLRLFKAVHPVGKNMNKNPSHVQSSSAPNFLQTVFTNILSTEAHWVL